jgi:hypothetical protein
MKINLKLSSNLERKLFQTFIRIDQKPRQATYDGDERGEIQSPAPPKASGDCACDHW